MKGRFSVTGADAGRRLDHYLSPRLPQLSGTKLRVLFAAGGVLRNGTKATGGVRLRAGDSLDLCWDPASLPPLMPEPFPLSVLWEDPYLVAVAKPHGMLIHPTMGVKRGTLANALLALWNPWLHEDLLLNESATPVSWPHFLHRLDRETSGIVLIARDRRTASQLGGQWAHRGVEKSYLAILEGRLPEGPQQVDTPIARVSETAPHWQATPQGKHARSILRTVAFEGGHTLAMLVPVTGRTNQLRIHAAGMGCPIIGDVAYGALPAPRLFLHAWRLGFAHPYTRNRVQLEAPPPLEFLQQWPGPWPDLSLVAKWGSSSERGLPETSPESAHE